MAKKKSKKQPRIPKVGSKKVYMCGVDWHHELGEVTDWTKVYSTVEDLKRQISCWKSCGIVEVTVKLSKWVEPQDLFKRTDDDLESKT